MKLSKEGRIGILVLSSLLIFFFGFYFLKGLNIFSGDNEYYCVFTNVRGVQNQSTVEISGLNIGHIVETKLVPNKGVRVKIAVRNDIVLPTGTTATLVSSDLLGGKAVVLELGYGSGTLKPGATIKSKTAESMIDNMSDQVGPVFGEVKTTITYLDTAIVRFNEMVNVGNRANIAKLISDLDSVAINLAQISGSFNKQNGDMYNIVHNIKTLTESLTGSSDTLRYILSNFKNISGQVAKAPIQKTLADLKSAMSQFDSIATKINHGAGTIGMLVNDKALYKDADSTMVSLHRLINDLQAHPKRYINIKVL